MTKYMIAFDCGNSSYRTSLGIFDGEKIKIETVLQEENDSVNIHGLFYWDMLKIYKGLVRGLKTALKKVPRIDSIGICTWGIDFALYRDGYMLSNPLCYRNTIGEEYLQKLSDEQKSRMFFATGILCDRINTIYALSGIKDRMNSVYNIADRIQMIPDILNYMLTGKMLLEPSEFSTSQMMDSSSKKLSLQICKMMHIREDIFPDIGHHGKVIGNILPFIKEELGIEYDIPVICVPSHDTASAVLAIPAEEESFAFISSGTWSLIGTEIPEPCITKEVMEYGLTNEVGAFDKITLLKNSAGMFIIQKIRKEYIDENKINISWGEMIELAEKATGTELFFDVNDIRFFNPTSMSQEIYYYLRENKQTEADFDWGMIIRSVYVSLAHSYKETIRKIEMITGNIYDRIYIVGGGSQNTFLNQLTADMTGKCIVACSKEATSLGNLAAQIETITEDPIAELRKIVRNSVESLVFYPS